MKWKHGGISRKHRQSQTDETRMIQEIYHGLSRMEQRVEALETILMDHQGKDRQT
jgi:phage shock protein B